jgi:hypothetical protein
MSLLISNFFWGDISPLADEKIKWGCYSFQGYFLEKMAQTCYTVEDSFLKSPDLDAR